MRRILLVLAAAAALATPGAANGPAPAGDAPGAGTGTRPDAPASAAPSAATPARAGTPAAPAAGAADCADRVAARVQAHYEAVRDLEARFEQETIPVVFGTSGTSEPFVARGTVVFAKPGRMRWEYEEPEPSLVVSDGETAWIYDPAAREAQHLPLGERFLSGAAIQFLLGAGDLRREFHVSAVRCSEERADLVLVPRTDAPYERLEIEVDPATGEVRETTVVDLLGNRTRVRLLDVRINRGPDDALFRFEPEPGVRVLELPPAS